MGCITHNPVGYLRSAAIYFSEKFLVSVAFFTKDAKRGLAYFVEYIQIDTLVQERRNDIANALELRLSCTNSSKWSLNISTSLNGIINI